MPRGHPHLPETESLRVEARDPPEADPLGPELPPGV